VIEAPPKYNRAKRPIGYQQTKSWDAASEANLVEFIKLRGNTKPHLIDLTQ
jgi:hypothetical protein